MTTPIPVKRGRNKGVKKKMEKQECPAVRPVTNNYYNIYKNSVLDKANNCLNTLDEVKDVVRFTTFGFLYSKNYLVLTTEFPYSKSTYL